MIDWLRRLVVGRGGNAEVPPETAPDPRFAEALEHHQHGRLNAAAQVYEDVLAERPDHVDALQGLGAVRLQQGDPAGATKCLRHAVALQPDRALAIREALGRVKPGDTLVVAGKGHEQYQIIGTEKRRFDDADVLKAELNRMGFSR